MLCTKFCRYLPNNSKDIMKGILRPCLSKVPRLRWTHYGSPERSEGSSYKVLFKWALLFGHRCKRTDEDISLFRFWIRISVLEKRLHTFLWSVLFSTTTWNVAFTVDLLHSRNSVGERSAYNARLWSAYGPQQNTVSKRISTDEFLFVAVGKWAALRGPRMKRGVTTRQFRRDFVAVN